MGLGRRRLREPERVAVLAHRRPERDGRAAADAALGELGGGGRDRGTSSWCHGQGATDRRRSASPAVGRGHQRIDVGGRPDGHDGTVGPGGLPARPGLARRLDPRARRRASRRSARSRPWNPTITSWSSRDRPAGLERLEIGRQVRLEVVVERRPAIADPAGQPGPGAASRRRSGWAAVGPAMGLTMASSSGIERRRSGHRPAAPTARAGRRRPPRDGRPARVPPGTGSRAPDARVRCRRCPIPRMSRPPLTDLERRRHPGQDGRMAVHHVDHERPDRHGRVGGRGRRQDRPGLDDRHRPVALADEVVPGPDPGIAGRVEPTGRLEPPVGGRPDRPDADADRAVARSRSGRGGSQLGLEQPDVLGR